jgi:plasmid stabilization system protein ParE
MNLSWSQTAKNDLQGIWDYIANDSVYYADKFIDELLSTANVLEDHPRIGRVVPEIGDQNTREIVYRSYRIMYLIQEEEIIVTQVTHGARDFKPKND